MVHILQTSYIPTLDPKIRSLRPIMLHMVQSKNSLLGFFGSSMHIYINFGSNIYQESIGKYISDGHTTPWITPFHMLILGIISLRFHLKKKNSTCQTLSRTENTQFHMIPKDWMFSLAPKTLDQFIYVLETLK